MSNQIQKLKHDNEINLFIKTCQGIREDLAMKLFVFQESFDERNHAVLEISSDGRPTEITLYENSNKGSVYKTTDPDLISQFQSLFTDERAKACIKDIQALTEHVMTDEEIEVCYMAVEIIKKHFGVSE